MSRRDIQFAQGHYYHLYNRGAGHSDIFREEANYLHLNPVKHGFTACPEQWLYSNYREWIGQRKSTLVDRGFVHEHFTMLTEYARFVAEHKPIKVKNVETYWLEE